LPANAFSGNPLAGQVIDEEKRSRAEPVETSIVVVAFEKGRRPRFVALGLKDKHEVSLSRELDTFTSAELHGLFTPSVIQQLLKLRYDPARREDEQDLLLGATSFVVRRGSDERESTGPTALSTALRARAHDVTWYAFLPAVVYQWYDGTLM